MRKFRTLAVAVTLGLLLTFSGCSQASESSNTVDDIVSSVFEDETTAEVTTEEPTTEEPTTEELTTEKPTEKPTQKPTKKPVKKVVEKHEDKSSQAETTLEFTNVTSSVGAGSFASVSIHGAPNTTYSITSLCITAEYQRQADLKMLLPTAMATHRGLGKSAQEQNRELIR